jgi:hypothetical protein
VDGSETHERAGRGNCKDGQLGGSAPSNDDVDRASWATFGRGTRIPAASPLETNICRRMEEDEPLLQEGLPAEEDEAEGNALVGGGGGIPLRRNLTANVARSSTVLYLQFSNKCTCSTRGLLVTLTTPA